MHWIYLIHEVSQFELNYWNKYTFPRHSNLLRCTCIWYHSNPTLIKNVAAKKRPGFDFNFLTRYWIWGPKERESSIKNPRCLYLETTSISKPWTVVIEHEFECADFLFVYMIHLDFSAFEQVLNRAVKIRFKMTHSLIQCRCRRVTHYIIRV